jgi:hypothetical protein
MAKFEQFIGETYVARAQQADSERSINLYPERIGSPTGRTKTQYTLLSKPGLSPFATLALPPPAAGDPTHMWLNFRGGGFEVSTGTNAYSLTGSVTDVNGSPTTGGQLVLMGAKIQVAGSPNPAKTLSATGTFQVDSGALYPWTIPTVSGYPPNGDGPAAAYYVQFQPPLPVNRTVQSHFVARAQFPIPDPDPGSPIGFGTEWASIADSALMTPNDQLYDGVALSELSLGGDTAYGQFGSVFPTADLTFSKADLYLSVVDSAGSGIPIPADPFDAIPAGTSLTVHFSVAGSATVYTATLTNATSHVTVTLPASVSVTTASLTPALTWNCTPPTFPRVVADSRLMFSIKLS